jgi:hypothetical protein
MFSISRTRPFQRFQKAAGISTFHINTVVVGLELVALGGQKPSGLDITWNPPKDPKGAVRQTRKFVLLAILTHVVDAFEVLLRGYADLPWINADQGVRDILKRTKTKASDKSYSIRERAEVLVDDLHFEADDALAVLDLMVSWRNALVHAGRARRSLPEIATDCLLRNKNDLAERYAGIDVTRALNSFSAGEWPTLKEATTMVAVCQNLARSIDQALIRREASTPEGIEQIAMIELAALFEESEARWRAISGRTAQKRYKVFASYLVEAGITEGCDGISAPLREDFVDQLSRSSRFEIEGMLSKTGRFADRARRAVPD